MGLNEVENMFCFVLTQSKHIIFPKLCQTILDGRGLEETNPGIFFPPALGQNSAKGDFGMILWGEWSKDYPYYSSLPSILLPLLFTTAFPTILPTHLIFSIPSLFSATTNIFSSPHFFFLSSLFSPIQYSEKYLSGLDKLPIILCIEEFVNGRFSSTKTNIISLSQNEYVACFYVLFPSWSPLFENINDRL